MEVEKLRCLCELTVALTELRMRECGHLSIENFAPTLLADLMIAADKPALIGRIEIERVPVTT